MKSSSFQNLFLALNFENWWWCGPFCFGLILSPLWHESPKTDTWVKYKPFNYFLPFGKQNMSEDYTKWRAGGIPERKDNTEDVEWKRCLCRILHFPFHLRLNTWDAHENILVLALAEIEIRNMQMYQRKETWLKGYVN